MFSLSEAGNDMSWLSSEHLNSSLERGGIKASREVECSWQLNSHPTKDSKSVIWAHLLSLPECCFGSSRNLTAQNLVFKLPKEPLCRPPATRPTPLQRRKLGQEEAFLTLFQKPKIRAHICPASTYAVPGTVLRALQMLTHLILTTTSEMNRQEAKCNQSDAPGNLGADWKDTELPFCGVKQPGGLFNAIGWLGKVGPRKQSTGSQANRARGSGEQTQRYGSFKKSVT